MDIKNMFVLLLFAISIIGIIAPVNAVSTDKVDALTKVKFKAKTVKLTLDANGGKIGSKTTLSKSRKIGSKINVFTIPHRKDYEFKGWYSKKSGGKKITKTIKLTRSVTLYAKWKKQPIEKKQPIDKTLKIKIYYNGVFHAGFGSDTKYHKGFTIYDKYWSRDLGKATRVDVGARKADGSSRTLTLKILKGNKVVAKNSTSAPYGEVKIDYKT